MAQCRWKGEQSAVVGKIQSLLEFVQEYTIRIDERWKPNIEAVRNSKGGCFPKDGMQQQKAQHAWFRGQPVDKPLLPKVFRGIYDETSMVLDFRRRARAVASDLDRIPDLYEYDEWLFLMQHHMLPTRLLDWTESPLIALFFAVNEFGIYKQHDRLDRFNPIVWMVNPHVLNWMFSGSSILLPTGRDEAGASGSGENPSQEGLENIKGAFNRNGSGIDSPLAVEAKHIHKRMHAQRSCFTIHGKDHRSLESIFENTDLVAKGYLSKLEIDKEKVEEIITQLKRAGVSDSILFPDFEGLSRDISGRFTWPAQ